MMASNDTANSTLPFPNGSESSNSGLAVGLPLFFVVLVAIGIILYIRQRKSKNVMNSNNPETMEDQQSKPAESHYTGLNRSSCQISESPVYENFRERPSDIAATRHYSNMDITSKSPTEPGDLYMQCDSEHDVIYSNDPSFSYCSQPDNCEEDVYIVPDA